MGHTKKDHLIFWVRYIKVHENFWDIDFVNLFLNGTSNSTPPPLVAHQFTEFYGWENYSEGEEEDGKKMYQHFLTKNRVSKVCA